MTPPHPGPATGRVVEDLRRRIVAGELPPGALLPSTRSIVREFAVAMATASRALAVLRDEGLVTPVPGVGTVVVGPPAPVTSRPAAAAAASGGPTGRTGGALTPSVVVAAGVRVADAEGLDAVTMRRVASELGVAVMSLYRHVADKDDLVERMLDEVLGGPTITGRVPPGWRAPVRLACDELWRRVRQHPWAGVALSLTRPQVLPAAAPYTELVFAGLERLGLPPAARLDGQLVLLNFVKGMAVSLDADRRAEADTGLTADEWVDERPQLTGHLVAEGAGPATRDTLERLRRTGYDLDLDALYELGVEALLTGLERRALAAGRPAPRRRPPGPRAADGRLGG